MDSAATTAMHKRIVEQVNEAFARNDMEAFFSLCTADVEWTIVGDRTVRGEAAIREWMKSMDPGTPKVTVDRIIAEGDFAAATGYVSMKDKDGQEERFAWCDVYRFQADRIAELKAFIIKTGL